ncbi:putative sulfate exporter family transporter [Nocardioides endophyticus]|uniref:Sulfate exporter family transporter n=1 Tax=Nocardioides endophyticus TaxID=1353775 RepID=A0ABP8ZDE2_9ACTN
MPLTAACLVTVVAALVPLLSPLLVALALGALVANTRLSRTRSLQGHAPVTKWLLRVGVVLLGLRLPVADVLAVGWSAAVVIMVTVVITYTGTRYLGRRLGLADDMVTLIAAGFSICGAAAIAAVSDAVQARERDVALAVALVTIFGSVMIGAVPALSSALGLSSTQGAVWAGASIHEVAQVVAAGSLIGTGAVAVATTVKLGRVALLAPTYAVAARSAGRHGEGRVPLVPWFVIGFAVAVAVRSLEVLSTPVVDVSSQLTTMLLAAGMFGLGLGLRLADLWPIPTRQLALAAMSTVLATGSSLLLIVVLGV